MGLMGNFSQFFGLNDEEEDYEYEEYDQKTEKAAAPIQAQEKAYTEPKSKASFNARNVNAVKTSNKVVPLNQQAIPSQSKIVVFEPRVYSEVQEVADLLMANESVILNFNRIEEDQAKRIVDFLTGTIYAISGDIQRIGDEIFLCTPPNVEIDGMLTEMMRDKEFY